MSERDIDRAAYLLARVLDDRPVDDKLLNALRRADAIRDECIAKLPHGRANVADDIRATDGENIRLHMAAKAVINGEIDLPEAPEGCADPERTRISARLIAAVQVSGTGTCSGLGGLALRLAAPRLGEHDRIELATSTIVDHSWAEWVSHERRIVVDPWARGPAIEAEDGRFSRVPDFVAPFISVDRSSAPAFIAACDGVLAAAERAKAEMWDVYDAARDAYPDAGAIGGHPSLSVFECEFAQRAASLTSREVEDGAHIPPRFGPEDWRWRVEEAAYESALRVEVAPAIAAQSTGEIIRRAKNLATPSREPIERPHAHAVLGARPISAAFAAQADEALRDMKAVSLPA